LQESAIQETLTFAPIHTKRTFEEICERIRAKLADGSLKPGDKLPAERTLALQLGVSRNVLREALRSLEMAGVLLLRKGVKGGAFIRNADPERLNDVLRDMLRLGSFSVDELTETRVHVQDLVVRLACKRATAVDLEALKNNIDQTEIATKEGRYLDRVERSREFYRLLAAAAHNQVLAMMVHSLTEILMGFVYARIAAGGVPFPNLIDKRKLFWKALKARDQEKATQLMTAHLESMHRLLEKDLSMARPQLALVKGDAADVNP
jgi:DNA-binding FadR family transcriptional regulator